MFDFPRTLLNLQHSSFLPLYYAPLLFSFIFYYTPHIGKKYMENIPIFSWESDIYLLLFRLQRKLSTHCIPSELEHISKWNKHLHTCNTNNAIKYQALNSKEWNLSYLCEPSNCEVTWNKWFLQINMLMIKWGGDDDNYTIGWNLCKDKAFEHQ